MDLGVSAARPKSHLHSLDPSVGGTGPHGLTVRAIVDMRDNLFGGEPTDLQTCRDTYERLRPSTAQQVLRFHRMQQTSAAAPAA